MPVKTTTCRGFKLEYDDKAPDGIAIFCKAGCRTMGRICIEGDFHGPPCGFYGEGKALTLGDIRERLGLDALSGEAKAA